MTRHYQRMGLLRTASVFSRRFLSVAKGFNKAGESYFDRSGFVSIERNSLKVDEFAEQM